MKKKIYLITGNHQQFIALKDYVLLLNDFLKGDFEIIESKNIKNSCINIIIDECTNKEFINQINNSKPDTKYVYFLTEFFTKSKILRMKSFNFFSNNELKLIFISLIVKLELIKEMIIHKIGLSFRNKITLNKISKSKYPKIAFREELEKLKIKISLYYRKQYSSKIMSKIHYLVLFFLTIIILIPKLPKFIAIYTARRLFLKIRSIILKFGKLIITFNFGFNFGFNFDFSFEKYMHRRYIGFKKIEHRINFFLCSHSEILNKYDNKYNKKIFFILNKLKEIEVTNKRLITISGECNSYRRKYIESLNINYPNNFPEFLKSNFLLKKEFGRYSINPKKNANWKYSSPMRYILSINNNEIPIVTDNFEDDSSQLIFLKMDFQSIKTETLDHNYNFFVSKVNLNIKNYNFKMDKVYKKIIYELKTSFNSVVHSSQ